MVALPPNHALDPVLLVSLPSGGAAIPLLPAPLNQLVGREREVAAICDLLRSVVRLVTLTGPGGVGKTRLALQVAEEAAEDFPDGVWFVPLATVRDPGLVPSAIAHALNVREANHRSLLEAITTLLRGRDALLILDNFEHVFTAAPLVTELLSLCPRLTCLATSRAMLRTSGEHAFPVPPLPLPPAAHGTVTKRAHLSPAVQLFVTRAQAARPDFALTDATAADVEAICRRLDGLPLAIELAAARCTAVPPKALLSRLEKPLPLLVGGPRDQPARLRTMRGAIAWSYDLLAAEEQALFRHLAVFVGGFTLEAAETVVGGWSDLGMEVVDGVVALVEASLLWWEVGADGEPRYHMLETIREFALEQLAADGQEEEAQERHAKFFLALAERAEPELLTGTQAEWVTRLEADRGNFRSALKWCTDRGNAETGLRLAAALWRFWHRRGSLEEGRGWLTPLLALAGHGEAMSLATRAKALAAAGWLAQYQNDLEAATTLLQEGLECDRQLGQSNRLGELLLHQGMSARFAGDYPQALPLLEEGLIVYRGLGDQAGTSEALNHLALVLRERGEYARATALYDEGLARRHAAGDRSGEAITMLGLGDIARDIGDVVKLRSWSEASLATFQELNQPWGLGFSLHNLAIAAYQEGDLERARSLCEESAAIFRRLGVRGGLTEVLVSLGAVLRATGEPAAAIAALSEALQGASTVGPRWLVAASLEGLAGVTAEFGQSARAARLAGAAATLRAAIGVPVRPNWRRDLEQAMTTARATLGDEAFAAAWTAGQELPLDEVVADATALTADQFAASIRPEITTASAFGLSPREVDVLRLLVAGCSDRDIAERLFISPRTASKHVGAILAKLDVSSRAEAAVLAVRDHLV